MTAGDDKRSPCAESVAPIADLGVATTQTVVDPMVRHEAHTRVLGWMREADGRIAALTSENERLRAAVKAAARNLYAIEVHRQSCGWDDGLTARLISVQHQLAAAHNDGYPATGGAA